MRLVKAVQLIIMILIIAAVTYAFYKYMHDRFSTVQVTTFYNSPFPVLNKQMKAWEINSYTVLYCKENSYKFHWSRYLLNIESGKKYHIPWRVYSLQKTNGDCRKDIWHNAIVSFKIPSDIPVWKYIIIIESNFIINQIRTITTTNSTQEFNIVL